MLIGLAFRGVSRWLQDHAGVQINSEKYTVEHRSATHFVIDLQDVEFTRAVWSFVAGPVLPFTAHSGIARDVHVEVSSGSFSIDVSGVSLRLRQCTPDEWRADAEAWRARFLKDVLGSGVEGRRVGVKRGLPLSKPRDRDVQRLPAPFRRGPLSCARWLGMGGGTGGSRGMSVWGPPRGLRQGDSCSSPLLSGCCGSETIG